MNIDLTQVEDAIVTNIDTKDYPDFCDAYIESAFYKGREMTEDELDALNDNGEFIYEQVLKVLY